MRVRHLQEIRVRRGRMRHRSLACLLALLMLSSVLAGPPAGRADESQSRFDHIDFVRLSAGCASLRDRDQRKVDPDILTLGMNFTPAEPFCDPSAVEKYLRQLLYSGLLKPDNGQERSREYVYSQELPHLGTDGRP